MFKNWWYRTIVLAGLVALLSGFSPLWQQDSLDVDRIVEENFPDQVVKVGLKVSICPFSCVENGEWIGIDLDIAREFVRRWFDVESVEDIHLKFIDVEQDDIPNLLESGDIDFAISAITHTAERDTDAKFSVDFSTHYFVDGLGMLVHTESSNFKSDTPVRNTDHLNGKSIVVIEGTTADCDGYAIKSLGLDLNCKEVQNSDRAIEDVLNDPELIFISDSIRLAERAAQDDRLAVVKSEFGWIYTFTDEPYAVEMLEGRPRLRELINATLQAMKDDGMLDALIAKHLPEHRPLDIVRIPGDISPLRRNYSKLELIEIRNQIMIIGAKCDTPPFGVLRQGAVEPEGFDVDLGRAIAALWNVDPRFECVTSSNRITKLRSNAVDMLIASMTKTWPRADLIAFSQTYFFDGQGLLVRAGSGVAGLEDLNGRTIGALDGSTSCVNIDDLAAEQGLSLDKNCEFKTTDQALEALRTGLIAAFTSDRAILSEFANQDPTLEVVGGLLSDEPYGIGLPQGDLYFIDLVNCSLQKLKANGEYDQIYARWFPEDEPYDIEVFPGDLERCDYDRVAKTLPPAISSKIDDIADRRPISVGVRDSFPPLAADGEGFDVALAKEFSRRWYNGDENAIRRKTLTAAERRSAIEANDESVAVDFLIAALTHTHERETWAAEFSQTYFLDGQSLLVKPGAGINSVLDLNDRIVGVIEDTTSPANLERAVAVQQSGGGPEIETQLRTFDTAAQALEALEANLIDAFISDRVVLRRLAAENENLIITGGLISDEPYTIAAPAHDTAFLNLVNRTLQEMKRDGTYDALYCQWFPDHYDPYDVEVWPDRTNADTYEDVNIAREEGDEPGNPCVDPSASPISTSTERPVSDDDSLAVVDDSPDLDDDGEGRMIYVVRRGDTLIEIAEEMYGDRSRWQELYNDNRDVIGEDPRAIQIGMELRIRR